MIVESEDATRQGLRGTVVGVDAEELTLTIETRAGRQIAVRASADTRIRIPGIETTSFGDIAEGDRVAVLGRFDPTDRDVFLARAIGVLATPDQAED
jgi:RNase P/RNase MRP subunit p29